MSQEKPYFGSAYEYEVDPQFPPSYVNVDNDVPSLPVEPGIVVRPVLGKRLNMSFIHFDPRSVAPVHQHREEQLGTVLEGSLEFELDGEKRILRKGDAYVAPPNVPHGAATKEEGCITLDVFSPPREGLREALERLGDRRGPHA
ncbi:MAG: cupin domain-containing protein [Actinomycetota bacterium]